MSDLRRIRDPESPASEFARDLVRSADADAPPAGSRESARARLEGALGGVVEAREDHADASVRNAAARPALAPRSSRRRGAVWFAMSATLGVAVAIAASTVVLSARDHGLRRAPSAPPGAIAVSPVQSSSAGVASTAGSSSAGVASASNASASNGGAPLAINAGGTGSLVASGGPPGTHPHAPRPSGHVDVAMAAGGNGGGAVAQTSASATSSGACASRCRGDITCLLNCGTQGGGGGGGAGGGSGGASSANVASTPSREDIVQAMNGVRDAVARCASDRVGTVPVSVTFASSGQVTNATVGGSLAGSPSASCIARALRRAWVPPFGRPAFTVSYPFVVH